MKQTQCERVIRHLKEVGSITSAEAMQEYGIYRLASRINDLKKNGIKIITNMVTAKNRYGEPTHFAKYSLEVEHGN